MLCFLLLNPLNVYHYWTEATLEARLFIDLSNSVQFNSMFVASFHKVFEICFHNSFHLILIIGIPVYKINHVDCYREECR
jgi:ABC-type antimicrobial peptide transport system permease subunit